LAFADDTTHHPQPLLPLRRGVIFSAAKNLHWFISDRSPTSFASLRMTEHFYSSALTPHLGMADDLFDDVGIA
jgi:hypothetical protein